jgi:hypothetical protein
MSAQRYRGNAFRARKEVKTGYKRTGVIACFFMFNELYLNF